MFFLTYNDAPDGVYFSQVTDVCRYWKSAFNENVALIAFISLHNFRVNKKKIHAAYPHSFVLPMFPGIENWRFNIVQLTLFLLFRKKENVIARGVFATLLAIKCPKFKKVCFDARGAYNAEWAEYLKDYSPTLASKMNKLEKDALFTSDYRIAVSQKLVDYWKEEYSYRLSSHVVIPCTINSSFPIKYDKESALAMRKKLNINTDDILLVYSGSSAEWQSFAVLEEYITKALDENLHTKLLLLAKSGTEKKLIEKYHDRVIQAWVKPQEVRSYLCAADYGLLVRDASVTNRVSSPVKFAEYLAAGLPVIISEGIGDYSCFIREKECGMLVDSIACEGLRPISEHRKLHIQEVAKTYFFKEAYKENYARIREM